MESLTAFHFVDPTETVRVQGGKLYGAMAQMNNPPVYLNVPLGRVLVVNEEMQRRLRAQYERYQTKLSLGGN